MKKNSYSNGYNNLLTYLLKKNENYKYLFHEFYFTKEYKKYNLVTVIFAFLRDIYIGIGRQNLEFNKKIFFFFTNIGGSGQEVFKKYKYFNKSNLIKVDLKRNRLKKTGKLTCIPDFLFIKNFILIFKSINWQKNHGIILLIFSLRLSFWSTIWLNFLSNLKNDKCKIYIHNDFDIYNSSLIYILKNKFLKKKIKTICFQHGIPTDEFFPTKADVYIVWSKHMLKLFQKANKQYGNNATKFKIENYLNIKIKILNKNIVNDEKYFFISQGHTKIYGEKLNYNLINFFTELDFLIPNIYCLLHPQETLKNNNYNVKLKKKLKKGPHIFEYIKKSNIYICFCSTAMIKCMQNQHIVIGIDIIPDNSLLAYKYFKPTLTLKNPYLITNKIELIKSGKVSVKTIIKNQNKYLKKILGPNIHFYNL